MSFIWPTMLFFLLLLPVGIMIYLRVQQRRRRIATRYGSLGQGLIQGASGRPLGLRRHIPPALFLMGIAILLVALARPQTVVSLPRVAGTVVLVFDVSGSMAADDVQPSRMEAAKAAAREFVQRQPVTVDIGIVAFSDSGLAVQAPSNDQATILAAIDRLAPQLGTSLGEGILAALNTIAEADGGQDTRFYTNLTPTPAPPGSYSSAIVVLLTDGENTAAPDPLEVAQTAADYGVRVYTVGIGSAAGATLNINGFSVHTKLEEALLQQIAQISAGEYFNAQNEEDLRAVYDSVGTQLVTEPEATEVTALFAGASILVLLLGAAFSMLWFSRLP